MMNPRYKPLATAAVVLLAAWALAFVVMRIAANAKMTSEKVVSAVRATDLEKLAAAERAKRLRTLADKLNALDGSERRRARADHEWDRLWAQMTESEKAEFIERTMPAGVKQMLTAFEQLPEDKRRYAVTNAIARMQTEREQGNAPGAGDGGREPLSEKLQKQMIATGLKTFYAKSSARTKAEVAPSTSSSSPLISIRTTFRWHLIRRRFTPRSAREEA